MLVISKRGLAYGIVIMLVMGWLALSGGGEPSCGFLALGVAMVWFNLQPVNKASAQLHVLFLLVGSIVISGILWYFQKFWFGAAYAIALILIVATTTGLRKVCANQTS